MEGSTNCSVAPVAQLWRLPRLLRLSLPERRRRIHDHPAADGPVLSQREETICHAAETGNRNRTTMMKPNTSAADYHAEGYCLFRDILDPGEVQELNA
ncbi:MAG: hypothetical protein CMP27_13370 [Roseibacillus sp.]|nr:hypothetical protein [Roseibacillus sp.]